MRIGSEKELIDSSGNSNTAYCTWSYTTRVSTQLQLYRCTPSDVTNLEILNLIVNSTGRLQKLKLKKKRRNILTMCIYYNLCACICLYYMHNKEM